MLLTKRHTYKPFEYPWAYTAWKKHEQIHWMPEEITLTEDVRDWATRLTPNQKSFLTQLFRFFTQADVSVADGYASKFLPLFNAHPEVTMMMLGFGAREAIHVDAYSLLIDTVGMPETEYSAFLDYAAMKDKYEFIENVNTDTAMDIAKALAIYSAFTEGMQLFSSFAMLMHFERLGAMKGMTNIVRWSIRDESIHAENMIRLYRTFVGEYFERGHIDEQLELRNEIAAVAQIMVELEDKFIDLAFDHIGDDLNAGLPESEEPLTKEQLKEYIRHVADVRLLQLGQQPIFGNTPNPLKWLDKLLIAVEHTNFFEAKPTEYSRGTLQGEVDSW